MADGAHAIPDAANKLPYGLFFSILTCLTSFLIEEEEENRLKRDGRGC